MLSVKFLMSENDDRKFVRLDTMSHLCPRFTYQIYFSMARKQSQCKQPLLHNEHSAHLSLPVPPTPSRGLKKRRVTVSNASDIIFLA